MEWVLDGGRPSLDLVNTVRDRKTNNRELLLGPAELAGWLVAAGLVDEPPEVGEEHVAMARRLRDAIDRLLFGVRDSADVDLVNEFARVSTPVPQLVLRDGALVAHVPPPTDAVAPALGRVAADAIALLTSPSHVRVCASTTCGIRFEDRSPARNRQWCSMKRCGNREKARLHYRRTRRADTSP